MLGNTAAIPTIRSRDFVFLKKANCLARGEISAEGEVEIDAVLEAEITEPDEGGAGTLGTALSFEILEEGGTFDSEGDVIQCSFFGEVGLFHFGFEEGFLLAKGVVGVDGGFDFAEGEEG